MDSSPNVPPNSFLKREKRPSTTIKEFFIWSAFSRSTSNPAELVILITLISFFSSAEKLQAGMLFWEPQSTYKTLLLYATAAFTKDRASYDKESYN